MHWVQEALIFLSVSEPDTLLVSQTSLCSVFQHTLFTAIQKHYSLEEWKTFAASHPECLEVNGKKKNVFLASLNQKQFN